MHCGYGTVVDFEKMENEESFVGRPGFCKAARLCLRYCNCIGNVHGRVLVSVMAERRDRDVRLDRRFDWTGEPDKVSKIRPIKLRRDINETVTEREFREAREALNEWNSCFWTEHNRLFERRKAEFVAQKRSQSGAAHVEPSANEMSLFYKEFLDGRRLSLSAYNREWYRRSFALLWPALKVNMIRFRRRFLRR